MSPLAIALAAVLAGVVGVVIGSFLTAMARSARAGVPIRESRCPHCDALVPVTWSLPVMSYALRVRCASCHVPIVDRFPIVAVATGVAFAGITWWFLATGDPSPGRGVIVVSYLYFAAISVGLTLIDLDTHRLPNNIVLPSYLVALALFTVACLLGAEWSSLLSAVIGMAALFAFYLLLRLIRPDGMGGGDVKLAGVVGLYLGWLGGGPLLVGALAAFLLGGVFGTILLLARKAGRATAIPFGPWILAGAWVGIVAGETIGGFYGGLSSR
jgi:leader peptidase (prepilin peptidase)/N-methyltransferase